METKVIDLEQIKTVYVPLLKQAGEEHKIEGADEYIDSLNKALANVDDLQYLIHLVEVIAENLTDVYHYDEAKTLYLQALDEVEQLDSYPNDRMYTLYRDYGMCLTRNEEYGEAMKLLTKAEKILPELLVTGDTEDNYFEAACFYKDLGECLYSKVIFGESDIFNLKDIYEYFQKAREYALQFKGTEYGDALLTELQHDLSDTYEVSCKNGVIYESWVDEALTIFDERIEKTHSDDPALYGSEIELLHFKMEILHYMGRDEEYEQVRKRTERLEEERESYFKKQHDDYMASLRFSTSFEEIKKRGCISKDESFDTPIVGSFSDEMNDLFAKNWACVKSYVYKAEYLAKSSELDYDVVCYECLPYINIVNDGATIEETRTNPSYDLSSFPFSRNVALFSCYSKSNPSAESWTSNDTSIRFFGIYKVHYAQNKITFERIDTKLTF